MTRISNQIELLGVRVGDVVREPGGRHEGVVLAAFEWTARVKWENGWREDLPLDGVEVVEKARQYRAPPLVTRPATVVMSPRRMLEEATHGAD